MAGLYIHIPFCKQACYYCNFHFSTVQTLQNDFPGALLKEMDLQRDYLEGEALDTVYFGGGTPSLLPSGTIAMLLDEVRKKFTLAPDPEITLEANPDDIMGEKPAAWLKAGINRLSIGIQSFYEEDLRWMHRAHHSDQAYACIELAKKTGFSNISIDLIYGSPTTSDSHWQSNLEKAIRLDIPHLSCYALTVEPRTALEKMIARKEKKDADPDQQARQFKLLTEILCGAGFEHYEISNFARPGFRSRHNSSYWQGKKYLGLGPSAHSFNGWSRQWNVSNNSLYLQSLTRNTLPFEREILTPVQRLNERIMTALRTAAGIDLEQLAADFGDRAPARLLTNAGDYLKNKTLIQEENALTLTAAGKFLADGIAARLFFDESEEGIIQSGAFSPGEAANQVVAGQQPTHDQEGGKSQSLV